MNTQNTLPPEAPEQKKKSSKTKGCLIALAIIILLGIIMSKLDKTPSPKTTERQTGADQITSFPEIAYDALRQEYENNEVAADNKYKGQIIIVDGPAQDIGRDILNQAYVKLGDADSIFGIQCMFDKSQEGAVGRLIKGQQVKIQGKVSGKLGSIVMRDCKLR